MSSSTRFFIFSAGYNCAEVAENCLLSIQRQTFKNYVHVVVDDASTDGTWERIARFHDDRVIAHRSSQNRKWLANAFEWLRPDDEDIVAIVDLDDQLAVPNALEVVADIYQREKCWLTYGNYCKASSLQEHRWLRAFGRQLHLRLSAAHHCRPMPHDVLERRAFREFGYCTSHLRTFKGFLWNALNPQDLRDSDGGFPIMAPDSAIMYPMLEMCKPGTIRFISKVLYIYNDINPLNEHKIDATLQLKIDALSRQKPKHAVLNRSVA